MPLGKMSLVWQVFFVPAFNDQPGDASEFAIVVVYEHRVVRKRGEKRRWAAFCSRSRRKCRMGLEKRKAQQLTTSRQAFWALDCGRPRTSMRKHELHSSDFQLLT